VNHAEHVRGWVGGKPETPCGRGSRLGETAKQRKWIPAQVEKYGITSIADIGAGDLNWVSRIDIGCDYAAYDLIPRVEGVQKLDLLTDELPKADCMMALWVLNHLSPADQKTAIDKLKSAGRFLIMTYDKRMEPCTNLEYVEKTVLRRDRGIDFEIRLIKC